MKGEIQLKTTAQAAIFLLLFLFQLSAFSSDLTPDDPNRSEDLIGHPFERLDASGFSQAARRDSLHAGHILGVTGSLQYPSQHGPFRRGLEHEPPKRANSPFDEQEFICPAGGCDFHDDRILVRLKTNVTLSQSAEGTPQSSSQEITNFLQRLPVGKIRPVFPLAEPPLAGATVARPDGLEVPLPDLTRWYRIDLDIGSGRGEEKMQVEGLVREMRTLQGVDYVEPDYQYRTQGQPDTALTGFNKKTSTSSNRPHSDAPPAVSDFYNDPAVNQLWHLDSINAAGAWQYLADQGLPSGGSADVVVAVVDSGVDYTHPDLAGSMWVNPAEFTGTLGEDSDGNGYIDDIHGASVIADSPSADPMDYLGHGTHVAGIIAMQGNNNEGGVGVAPNVKIMAVRAGQYAGRLSSSDIARGIEYAVDNGADVINMSFGGYYRSQILEDALANAFGYAVLVAAAGNDALPTFSCPLGWPDRANLYPGAYNWTLGVKALAPGDSLAFWSNFDCRLSDAVEYEVAAPGAGIYSTLPYEGYGVWSGTSMAAPVVSAMAAMARSLWSDKSVYSSRFIMGQVASTGPELPFVRREMLFKNRRADAQLALSTAPQPELHYLEHWIFDTTEVDPGNDADGIADSGEIVDLGVVIRNQWGKADNVTVRLDAWAPGAVGPDPYVIMLEDEVHYGALGSFNNADNGLLVDEDGAVIGVEAPFRFTTPSDAPNDHLIPFRLTMTADNGFDSDMPAVTTYAWFYLLLQRGRELPRIVSEDLVMTKDDYWLVPDAVLIEEGVTVTVTEGTQIQFFSIDPKDPYADQTRPRIQVEGEFNVQGTAEEPVEIFTGFLYEGFPIEIQQMKSGDVFLSHTRMLNPVIGHEYSIYDPDRVARGRPLTDINNSYFAQEIRDCIVGYDTYLFRWSFLCNQHPIIRATEVRESQVYNVGYDNLWEYQFRLDFGGSLLNETLLDSVLFRGDGLHHATDTVFLKNYRTFIAPDGTERYKASRIDPIDSIHPASFLLSTTPVYFQGNTYVSVASPANHLSGSEALDFFDRVQSFAQSLDGNIISINSEDEQQFLWQFKAQLHASFADNHGSMECGHEDWVLLDSCWALFRGSFIIGLIDRNEVGRYEWISGDPIDYENWNHVPGAFMFVSFRHLQNGPWVTVGDLVVSESFVLELPGEISMEKITSARAEFISNGHYGGFARSAFLNDWVDLNIDRWLRFYVRDGRNHKASIANNYFQTTSKTKIDAAIWDFNDNFNYGTLQYEPMLTEAPETAYPFVTDIEWETENGLVEEVGIEPVEFLVHFNRDMDTTVDPMVSFGPATPYTDFVISGSWDNPRLWRGQFDVNPITGDGWQYMRVVGAVAANNPWLTTGNDYGRFRFQISTSGAASMSLQATGDEGKINLQWRQTDFETVAGYNLYRAPVGSENYERINNTLLPQGMTQYEDRQVAPGQNYYYYFTVVQTNLSESEPSNTAVASALDTVPPVISHTPVSASNHGQPVTLRADVTDNVGIQDVHLYHRVVGEANWRVLSMAPGSDDSYAATIVGSRVASPGVEYYIQANDGINVTRDGRPEFPHLIVVEDRPMVTAISPSVGPSAGGTNVVISGSRFQSGASVWIGSVSCSDVVVVSETRIECVTGGSTPGPVDVRVSNPSGEVGMLLNGFTYQGAMASISFPDLEGRQGSEIQVPLSASDLEGAVSLDLEITYDPSVIMLIGSQVSDMTVGWGFPPANTATEGVIRISMATGNRPTSGSGNLLILKFVLIGQPASSSSLAISDYKINDGAISAVVTPGSIAVESYVAVTGAVNFWNGDIPVPDTLITLSGDVSGSHSTDTDGQFSLDMKSGSYTLRPSRMGSDEAISAYDASLVLQHAAGLITLSGSAFVAGDANQNGSVSAYDAFLILQHSVGLSDLPFTGAGRTWVYEPSHRTYEMLTTDQSNQNFTAILLGDPSGNWAPSEVEDASFMTNNDGEACATVRIGNVWGPQHRLVSLPMQVSADGINAHSLEFDVYYDPNIAEAVDVELKHTWDGATMQFNEAQQGILTVGIASAQPLDLSHSVAQIHFRIKGEDGQASEVSVVNVRVNESVSLSARAGLIGVGGFGGIFQDRFDGDECW